MAQEAAVHSPANASARAKIFADRKTSRKQQRSGGDGIDGATRKENNNKAKKSSRRHHRMDLGSMVFRNDLARQKVAHFRHKL